MGKIDLSINKVGLEHNIQKAKENNVIIPTIAQMQHPETIPEKIQAKLKNVGLWDVNPLNLFRITWKNEAKESGGLFQEVPNYVEIPSELSGVKCRIVAMAGKWFPTGCHKVGASFGCLAPRLVTGQFDATYHHAVWPSTGNYCRGGAFNSKLLAVDSVAILPAEMSKERFDWLSKIAGQVIATPGCESNVKEIFDKTWELKKDPSMMIFNQFAEMGNPLWHYNVTGYALADLFEAVKKPGQRLAGACFTSGSAGTMSSGDLLKERYPGMKLAVGEALQCPTILDNGFGGHRIEGIGDKHIPWVHNVKNTDMAIAIDDEDSQRLLRLFNCKEGQEYLKSLGMTDEQIEKFTWMGISGIANVLCCIKMAKYYELTEDDVVVTVLTDSAVMYKSRVEELNAQHGAYSAFEAEKDHALHMLGLKTDSMLELTYTERKRVHNLKYYTWVEQQGMNVEDLNAQWYDMFALFAAIFQLNTISWLLSNSLGVGITAAIIIFQPELRRALEQLGRKKIFSNLFSFSTGEYDGRQSVLTEKTINEIVRASYEMGAVKTGALMVIEQNVALGEYVRTGISIDGIVSSQLLINIFEHNTPLHDGAVIIRGNRIVSATCYLPLTDSMDIGKELGTRHRAAVGISEVSDSLTIIVSEETGAVSLAKDGNLYKHLKKEELLEKLKQLKIDEENNTDVFKKWKDLLRNEKSEK